MSVPYKSPLCKALDREKDNEDYAFGIVFDKIDPFIDKAPNPIKSNEVQEAFRLTLRSLSRIYIEDTYHSLYDAFSICESPIEAMFMSALLVYASTNWMKIRINANRRTHRLNYQANTLQELIITPQYVIGDYRIDFWVEFEEIVPDFDNEIISKNGEKIPGSRIGKASVLVECDGHEFHEKTKEQAAKDKKRDRMLQSIGFHVFRFTGSEIWKNPLSCAQEVFQYLEKKVWE